MSKVYESIMSGLEEAITLKQVTEIFKGIPVKRVLELAAAEREGRVVVLPFKPNGVYALCPGHVAISHEGTVIFDCAKVVAFDITPEESDRYDAEAEAELAASAGKGET